MKNYVFYSVVIIFVVGLSCGKKEPELTPKQIQQRADSIVRSKIKSLEKQAKEDLAKRLPIEIKPKMDSIRNSNFEAVPVPVFPDDGATTNESDSTL